MSQPSINFRFSVVFAIVFACLAFLSLVYGLSTHAQEGAKAVPTPIIGEIILSHPEPIALDTEIGIGVSVSSSAALTLTYQWVVPEGQGEIIAGQNTSGVTYQTPHEAGDYAVTANITATNSITTILITRAKTFKVDSSLIGWWKLDERAGRRVANSSGSNNIGGLQGAVAFTTTAVLGHALDFKTAEAEVIISHSSNLEPITGTITVWVRVGVLPVKAEGLVIWGKTNQSTGAAVYHLRIYPDGAVAGVINGTAAQTDVRLITPGRWYHLALTWDGNIMSVYVDGKEEAISLNPPTPAYDGATPFVWSPSYYQLDNFIGQLDEIRFYNRALSLEEIWKDYERGTFACSNVTETLPLAECEALVALYNSTGGATTWYTDTYWLEPGSSPCKWYGVTCLDNRVTALYLPGNGLDGEIPPELGNLTELTTLNLGSNLIEGDLPDLLGELPNLTLLRLAGNPVTGKIPRTLLKPDLVVLDLEDTRISDTIPINLDQLVNLESFRLGSPNLTGEIPVALGQLPKLKHLVLLSRQKLTGSFVPIFKNKNLVTLYIMGNGGLVGEIPPEIDQLTELQDLRISDDGLTGSIPPTIGNLPNLQILLIERAQITGSIPAQMGHLSKLAQLVIQNTQISGTIPSELGNLSNLTTLKLNNNRLTGLIPSTFIRTHLPNLTEFDLSYNDALNATDPQVLEFLNQKDPDWAQTQRYNLVGHWQFDECNDGNEVKDSSGLENHGTLQGGVKFTNNAISGCALDFTQEGDHVAIKYAPSLEPLTGTIALWIKLDEPPQQEIEIVRKLFVAEQINVSQSGYGLQVRPDQSVFGRIVNHVDNYRGAIDDATRWSSVEGGRVEIGKWYHLALRWNDKPEIAIFVNGELINSQPYTPTREIGTTYCFERGFAAANCPNNVFQVGIIYGDPPHYFIGKVDDLRFYARALSDEEIQRDYQLYADSVAAPITVPLTPPANDKSSSFCLTVGEILPLECEALVALYNSTDGRNWITKTNWLETNTPCSSSWYGVICEDGEITTLNLSNNQMSGVIPPELGRLIHLADLDLHGNLLTEWIPPQLGDLANLTSLDLSNNHLMGAIPPQLGQLHQLSDLDLSTNQLNGWIPPELGDLNNLIGLRLANNQLIGTIPPQLGHLVNLQYLDLASNQLDGAIPGELGNLRNLTELNLPDNQLSGEIPLSLANLSDLTELDLDNNHLSASDPRLIDFLNKKAPGWLDSQTQLPTVGLIVANFNSCAPTNNLGGAMGPAYNPPDQMKESYPSEAGRGCVVKLEYMGKGWGGFWLKLQGADLSQYHRLTFDVKADPQLWIPGQMKIELKRDGNKEMSIKYIGEITADWQTIVTELADFGPAGTLAPLSAMTEIEELSFVVESNGSDATSIIYIDNVAFMAEDER